MPCDVVILPSVELSNKAIRASRSLESLGTLFTLQTGKYYPHASVYMLQIKVDNLPKAMELLSKIVSKTNKLKLTATRYYETHNYFDAEYQKIAGLTKLQKQVVEALNPIRDGMREHDKARMAEATGLALENFRNYGWNTIGELYRPHLTITRFSNEQQRPEQYLPDINQFSGEFPKLGLFETGDNGTAVRQIAEFDFSDLDN